ncbi:MAG: 6-phosphogluconolactonase [Gammaproteobacteria bacterium]
MQEFINSIIAHLNSSINEFGSASIVTCGGSSPINIFKQLSLRDDIDWSNVNLTLLDDRKVSIDHPDSNEKLLIYHFAKNYAQIINIVSLCNIPNKVLEIKRPFDIMLIGLGGDGHFASLFPELVDNKECFDVDANPEILFLGEMGDPKHERVSMNLSLILQSKKIVLISSSDQKNKIIEQAFTDKALPLYYLLNQNIVEIDIYDLVNSKPLYFQGS